MIERGLVDACSQASTSADIRSYERARLPPLALHFAPRQRRCQRRTILSTVQAVSAGTGAGLLQKLGRVLREKAATDLERITKGTSKTREKLGVVDELFSYWTLEDSEDTLEQLEDLLITADFGPKTALKIVDAIRDDIRSGRVKTRNDVRSRLKQSIVDVLNAIGRSSDLQFPDAKPAVLLIVGVNGGGKTTTIGKLAYKYGSEGVKVLLVAGDTFRAAAAEQLAGWAERSNAQLISASSPKQRPDSLMYSAVEQAVTEGTDLVICDTSGRLHTNIGLMEELAKCKRSISKRLPGAPHEVLLILDGTTGLNMLNQAREFNETVQLTGLVLTKLDGTARGGAVVSVVDELRLPIKFVGVGETVEDLQPFNAEAFVNALFPESS
ncbi:g6458 [Coccomyxa elongata]